MKTSIKILWIGFGLMLLSAFSIATMARLDLHEIEPIDGNGIVIEKTIPMESFIGFTSNDNLQVKYLPGPKHEIRLKTDSNLVKYVHIEIHNNDWVYLSIDDEVNNSTVMEATIYSPKLVGFNAHNSSDVVCDSIFDQERLEINTSNSASARIFAITGELTLRARNSSMIYAKGQTEDIKIEANNSGVVEALDELAQFADVTANGAGKVKVSVESRLVSKSRAGGSVLYSGPTNLNVKASGNGSTQAIKDTDSPSAPDDIPSP